MKPPRLRGWLTTLVGTVAGWLGAYASTDPRNTVGSINRFRPRSSTWNDIAAGDLPMLRSQCRDLERRNPSYRAAVEGLVANIVGSGIGLEPTTGDPALDARIRPYWMDYLGSCGINGEDIDDLEALGCREAVNVGSLIWRLVTLPDRAERGLVPVVVLPLEAEWLSPTEVATVPAGHAFNAGIETDRYGREVAYHLRNPDLASATAGLGERITVDQCIHWFDRRRALQNQGEPWMAPSIETLFIERDLVRAELASAKNTAAMSVILTTTAQPPVNSDNPDDITTDIPVGAVTRLYPGEDAKAFSHTRPSQQIAPFRQMLRGDVAAAARLGQRWLDRDVSRANYSSMRADQQDEERLINPVRWRFGQGTIGRLYQAVLPYLAIQAGIPVPKATYRLLPDGSPYVNPIDDIKAALLRIAAGQSTFEEEASLRGKDVKAIIATLKTELQDPLLKRIFDAAIQAGSPTPAAVPQPSADDQADDQEDDQEDDADPADEDPTDQPDERIVEELRPIRDADGVIQSVQRIAKTVRLP